MKPSKVYIIKIDTPASHEYAKTASDSCDRCGMPWEYLTWYTDEPIKRWRSIGIPIKNIDRFRPSNKRAQLVTAAHAYLWKKIVDTNEAAIIFEHDALLLHKVELDIPDNLIAVLGYKLQEPTRYDHETAGPPKSIVNTQNNGHEGAHAYAITPETARLLLKELEVHGIRGAIDNTHFLKARKTNVPIKIMDPTPAIGWIRDSTIWKKSSTRNYKFIPSFEKNLK